MAKFLRYKEDEFLNIDKIVSYNICRVIYEDYEKTRPERYYIRFYIDSERYKWVETDTMDLESIESMTGRINE